MENLKKYHWNGKLRKYYCARVGCDFRAANYYSLGGHTVWHNKRMERRLESEMKERPYPQASLDGFAISLLSAGLLGILLIAFAEFRALIGMAWLFSYALTLLVVDRYGNINSNSIGFFIGLVISLAIMTAPIEFLYMMLPTI